MPVQSSIYLTDDQAAKVEALREHWGPIVRLTQSATFGVAIERAYEAEGLPEIVPTPKPPKPKPRTK